MKGDGGVHENPRAYLDRMIEVLRQSRTLRLPGNKTLQFDNVRSLAAVDHEQLHAEAIEQGEEAKRIAVVFGPEDGAINSNDVLEASREACYLKFDALEKSPVGDTLYQVTLLGLDIFPPHDLETESIAADNLPCWMLDTDYNGMCFCARRVFFPKTAAWDNLQKSLKGRFSESVWEHLVGTTSEPFVLGSHKRIAVKVIDERGNELMVIREKV